MLYRNHWLKIVSLSLVAVLTIGLFASAGIARADGTATPEPTTSAPTTQPTQSATQQGPGSILRNVMGALIDAAASNTGVDAAMLRKELPGKSLADVIKAHNGDVDKVKAAAKATLTTQINQAVTDGKITQDQANRLLGRLDSSLDRLMNLQWPTNAAGANNGNNRQNRVIAMMGLQILIRETAKEANISQRDLLKELRDGKTLSQIATEHNADPTKIVSAAVQTATDQVNRMVKSGRISQDQANQIISGLQSSFTDLMNKANPMTNFGNQRGRRNGSIFGRIFGWLFGGRGNRGNGGNRNGGASGTPEPTVTPQATPAATGQAS